MLIHPASALREHLLLAQNQAPPTAHQTAATSPPVNSHEHNIDPAIAGQAYSQMSAGDSGGDDQMQDTRKGRRELSTSKRAAQNRAAQVSSRSSIFVFAPFQFIVKLRADDRRVVIVAPSLE